MPESSVNKTTEEQHSFFSHAWDFFYDLIDLKQGMDKEGTIISIKNNKEMKGANAWLLMCSILIASLGLDLNSPAVIIGAMLISPLMAPILGIGLGIGINDRNTLITSGKHLLIAIGIALVTSTFYFSITHALGIDGGFTNEIKGRTRPSILDAMVALIGGLAGIISSSRKDKSNAIPGVAIATALMPPLCVTGYGISQWFGYLIGAENFNLNFGGVIFNSFFLFILNATLVALATYLIVQLMDFPSRAFASEKEERQSKFILYTTSILLLGVSLFTTYTIIVENRTRERIQQFSDSELRKLNVLECDVVRNLNNTFDVNVYLLRDLNDRDSITRLYSKILRDSFHVNNANLNFRDLEMDDEKFTEIIEQTGDERVKLQQEISLVRNNVDSLENALTKIQEAKAFELNNNLRFFARANFPDLKIFNYKLPSRPQDAPSIELQWNDKVLKKQTIKSKNEKRLKELVIDLMELDTLTVTNISN